MKTPAPSKPPLSPFLVAGLFAIAIAAIASGVLLYAHFWGAHVPGCGVGGGCDRAAKSPWAAVPLIGWPVSLVGFAYFAAMFAGVAVAHKARQPLARPLRLLAYAGGAVSLVYLIVMGVDRLLCAYCLVTHIANLAFIATVFRERSARPGRSWQATAFAAVGIVLLVLLGVIETDTAAARRARSEREAAESTRQLLEAAQRQKESPPTPPQTEQTTSVTTTATTGFEGRYRIGPATAAARVVIFTDYQCEGCKGVEEEVEKLLNEPGLAVSFKNFPMSTDCNPDAPGQYHENACWAARAAEAGGILAGTDGFLRIHRWLFQRRGMFTEPELRAALPALGFDPGAFIKAIDSYETEARVKADVDEGRSLGLDMTPMIYINGIELKGWDFVGTTTKAIRALLASRPTPATSVADHPLTAPERALSLWREKPGVEFPPELFARGLGPADATVRVVIFGDLLEPFTSEVDGITRLFTQGPEPAVRYVFLHYPVNQGCNPSVPRTIDPRSCDAHRALESAFLVGGPDGFWQTHQWIMTNRSTFSVDALLAAAPGLGLDAETLKLAMQQPMVPEKIQADTDRARSLGITSIPFIFVNGKHVPRWKAQAENILPRVFREASKQAPK